MPKYQVPEIAHPNPVGSNEVLLVASGDVRETANRECWAAQADMEARVVAAFAAEGVKVIRAHAYDPQKGHGFISSQRMGIEVFRSIHKDAPLIIAESVWQYSYHVLAGLRDHRGPILTIANWSGQWPGLVGLLNLNACLTKMDIHYSTIWSEDFTDPFFIHGIRQWLKSGEITHDLSHVRDLQTFSLPAEEAGLGKALAKKLSVDKAILGVFDEGCMGMYNAIIDDEMLNKMGIYKERLSQSALVAEMRSVSDIEAQAVRIWLDEKGLQFVTGSDPAVHLTDAQVVEQCKMYIAAGRMADRFGCDVIGIQYQLGLMDMVPASDLVEGLLNNADRPPIFDPHTGQEIYQGKPIPHFNEADEGQAVDALVTNWVWSAMGLDPANTLHDVRWGEHYQGAGIDDFVWTLMISGAIPASHVKGGYPGARSLRQPAMYFRMGGGTLTGIGKPGEIVWSRVYVQNQRVQADLGLGRVVDLPVEEVNRRWQKTTPEWPIVNTVFYGLNRDQFMAKHKANHVCIAYAPSQEAALKALVAKAAMLDAMGIDVHICGIKHI